jgi:hypothetical protein
MSDMNNTHTKRNKCKYKYIVQMGWATSYYNIKINLIKNWNVKVSKRFLTIVEKFNKLKTSHILLDDYNVGFINDVHKVKIVIIKLQWNFNSFKGLIFYS